MGLAETIQKGIENIKDTVSEIGHKSNAQTEQTKRDIAGDDMTLGEKTSSVLNQGKESLAADYDATKKDIRNGPTDV